MYNSGYTWYSLITISVVDSNLDFMSMFYVYILFMSCFSVIRLNLRHAIEDHGDELRRKATSIQRIATNPVDNFDNKTATLFETQFKSRMIHA